MGFDNGLSKRVSFNIKEKGGNEKARLANIREYQGPDEETVDILRRNHYWWLQNPSTFWLRPEPESVASMHPQAQIVGFFLQAKRDDV